MMRCFWPPERLVPRSETIVSSFSGKAIDEVLQFGRRNRLLEIRILDRLAERDVLAQREIEHDRVLKDEADLKMQRLLVVFIDAFAVEFDAARSGLQAVRSADTATASYRRPSDR